MQNRDSYFDILKGIAILLVVLGHSLQYLSTDYKTDNLFLGIIMFHMPLFMVVSGRFLQKSISKVPLKTYIVSKIRQLLVPSITYGTTIALFFVLKDIYNHSSPSILYVVLYIYHGLWYLVSFFYICIFIAITEKSIKTKTVKTLIWISSCIAIQFLPYDLVTSGVKFLLPFAFLAIVFKDLNWARFQTVVSIGSLIGFIICFKFYSFGTSMYSEGVNASHISYWYSYGLRFLSGLFGIIIICTFSSVVAKIEKLQSVLSWIGQRTLPIYILQSYIFFGISWLYIDLEYDLIQLLIGIVIITTTLAVYEITRKNKFIRLILFGENTPQNNH